MPAALTTISGVRRTMQHARQLRVASLYAQGQRSEPPCVRQRPTSAARLELLRSWATSTTAAPASASAPAISRPIPELAPVTRATRPPRSKRGRCHDSMRAPSSKRSSGKYFASRSSAVRACASIPSSREMRAVAGAIMIGRACHALPRNRLDELMHRQSTRVPRCATRRQHVIRTGRFVAECDRGFLTKKKRAVAGEIRKPPIEVLCVDFEVLGGVAIGDFRNLSRLPHSTTSP